MPATDPELRLSILTPGGPNVVALGGGHGQAAALEAIQTYAGQISALVSVADDGGSSGRLRDLGLPPPGDIRRCLLALVPEPTLWSELFAHRFRGGDVKGHSLGNLIIAGLADLHSSFPAAVEIAGEMLGTMGEVVPLTAGAVTLHAIVDGDEVVGQRRISAARGRCTALSLTPQSDATESAIRAVQRADQIVLGPGSFYTSVMAALMAGGLAESITKSSAQKVFILNLVTQDGETLGMTGTDHLSAMAELTNIRGPGVVVAHEGPLKVPEGLHRLTVDEAALASLGWRTVTSDIVDSQADWPQHDPIRLGLVLEQLATLGG